MRNADATTMTARRRIEETSGPGPHPPMLLDQLAAEAVRRARLATALHLAEAARRRAASDAPSTGEERP